MSPVGDNQVKDHFDQLRHEDRCLICQRKLDDTDGVTVGPLCDRERCQKAYKRYAETPVNESYFGTVVIKEMGE